MTPEKRIYQTELVRQKIISKYLELNGNCTYAELARLIRDDKTVKINVDTAVVSKALSTMFEKNKLIKI